MLAGVPPCLPQRAVLPLHSPLLEFGGQGRAPARSCVRDPRLSDSRLCDARVSDSEAGALDYSSCPWSRLIWSSAGGVSPGGTPPPGSSPVMLPFKGSGLGEAP